MVNQRHHSSIKCFSYCLLMGRDGNTYEALLGDISLGGALVKVSGDTHLQPGDLCDLMLSAKLSAFPLKRAVKIVRRDSENMGVRFL